MLSCTVHMKAFTRCFSYNFVCLFYMLLIRCNSLICFTTFRTSQLEDWFRLPTRLAVHLTHMVFRQSWCKNTIITLLKLMFLIFPYFHHHAVNFCCVAFFFTVSVLLCGFNHKMHERSIIIWQKLKVFFNLTHSSSFEYRLLSGLLQLLHVWNRCRFAVA